MIEEEGDWYPELAGTAPAADQQLMTKNYTDAYTRFVGSEAFA
jgi:hypothetical protein